MVVNGTGFQNRWVHPPAKETVRNILLGHPHSLELYRSLKSKTELLDAAISIGDGNAILAVRLWIFAFTFYKIQQKYRFHLLHARSLKSLIFGCF